MKKLARLFRKISPLFCTLAFITLLFFSSSCNPEGIEYSTLNYASAVSGSSTYLTGIRGVTDSEHVYISGIYTPPGDTVNSGAQGLLYTGPILGGGTWQVLNYPSSSGLTVTSTALYGPNNGTSTGNIQIVGSYTTSQTGGNDLGLLYQGPTDGSGTWATLNPQSLEERPVINTIAHSTMGGLVVGNYDTDLESGKAFIYNIATNTYFELSKPNAVSITAYGIWYNGNTIYTIAGGYSDVDHEGLDIAYLVDWDTKFNTASNWTSYTYNNQPSVLTHFEGITTDGEGGYNLVADWGALDENGDPIGAAGAAFVNVPRTDTNGFGTATWTDFSYPGSSITSGNTVYTNHALGIYKTPGSEIANGYVATFPQ